MVIYGLKEMKNAMQDCLVQKTMMLVVIKIVNFVEVKEQFVGNYPLLYKFLSNLFFVD